MQATNNAWTRPLTMPEPVVRAPADHDEWRRLFEAEQDGMPSRAPELIGVLCACLDEFARRGVIRAIGSRDA